MTIYDRIRQLRINLGLSQDELARKMGYKDRSMITKIESGHVDISQSKVMAFADALCTTPAYLMGWEDNPRPDVPVFESRDEEKLVNTYRSLSPEGKEYLMQQLKIARMMDGIRRNQSNDE